jgi:hypothetical protein
MEQVRVNLTIERSVWEQFSYLVPNRQKSKVVNALLKHKIEEIIRQNENKEFSLAFKEAAGDKDRLQSISEWEHLDSEGWD